jgi:hypothetical protein
MRIRSLLIIGAIASTIAVPNAQAQDCVPGDTDAAPKLSELPGFPEDITGHYALPQQAEPTKLVVFGHGYRNTSDSWVCHLLAAADHGAVAVATDYAGTGWTGAPGDNRGWPVTRGAAEMVASALFFKDLYPSIDTTGLFGVSRGGNATGLAASAMHQGLSVFDYWVDVEGATNSPETYFEAQLIQHAGGATGAYAAGAVEDFEHEVGVSPEDDPVAFAAGLLELSVVLKAPEIAAAELDGIAVVHGLDDGLVPYNQSRELVTALRAAGASPSMYTVLRRNDWQNPDTASTEAGTVLSSNVAGPLFGAAGQSYPAPFAGHGWEGSSTHLVIKTGFDVLWGLMDGLLTTGGEYLVDSELETIGIP